MNGKKFILIFLLISALGLNGCLFDPREPEPPGGGGTDFEPPDDAYGVVANMEKGFGTAENTGYDEAIAENFIFIPSQRAISDYSGIFSSDWGREREMGFLNSLKSVTGSRTLDFPEEGSWDEENAGATEAELRGEYTITVTEDGETVTYEGDAILYFNNTSGQYWQMIRWEDITENLNSSGHLRGLYAAE